MGIVSFTRIGRIGPSVSVALLDFLVSLICESEKLQISIELSGPFTYCGYLFKLYQAEILVLLNGFLKFFNVKLNIVLTDLVKWVFEVLLNVI